MKQIHIIGGAYEYANWITPLGFEITHNLNENTALCMLTGGEDWHYSWTGCENPHPEGYYNLLRDKREMQVVDKAMALRVPLIGICRGSQILPYLIDKTKGKLVQHQNNPAYIHPMTTYDGQEIHVTSTHHACAYPYLLDKNQYKLLGWSNGLLKFRYLNRVYCTLDQPETEVVAYGRTAIGFQMHPEMQFRDKSFARSIEWYQQTLLKFLRGEF